MDQIRLYDSHCHLSPDVTINEYDELKKSLGNQEWPINLMMTNHIDRKIIFKLMDEENIRNNKNVLLNVGIHPWFTHLYTNEERNINEPEIEFKKRHYFSILEKHSKNASDEIDKLIEQLPIPENLDDIIEIMEDTLKSNNNVNIGEIGIDKVARIPNSGYLGNSSTISGLSNYRIKMSHQLKIFKRQLNLIISVNRKKFSTSMHCVGAQGTMYECLKKFDGLIKEKQSDKVVNMAMHSYSGSIENAKMLLKLSNVKVWFGISEFVNLKFEKDSKRWLLLKELLHIIRDCALVETDFGVDRMKNEHKDNVLQIHTKLEELEVNDLNTSLYENWCKFRQV